MEKHQNVFYVEQAVIDCDTFNAIYPAVNEYLLDEQGGPWLPSRDGNVKEILDVKTHIRNPYRRCVGGYGRNINVFFLLAEAMWIALGRKDVRWLTMFNKQMEKYSDDGHSFHAPYGYRIRHWGSRSEDVVLDENSKVACGFDQLSDAVRLFGENPNTRQVVMSIWNPLLDLGFKTKDIPCNDIVMMKIRNGSLITTIGNRSNDLHLGLPTNIFQFSFLAEIVANILNVSMGTQTHNSQSLHVYDWNKSAFLMRDAYKRDRNQPTLYDLSEARPMDFAFVSELPVNRLVEVDTILKLILKNATAFDEGAEVSLKEESMIHGFSLYLFYAYQLLLVYLRYRHATAETKDEAARDEVRENLIGEIAALESRYNTEYARANDVRLEDVRPWDISLLAKNFLAARLSSSLNKNTSLGKL